MRAILILAGAVACFGAGAAWPQIRKIAFGDGAWLPESTSRPDDTDAYGIKPHMSGPIDPKSNRADPKSSDANSSGSHVRDRDASRSANAGASSFDAAPERQAAAANQSLPAASDPGTAALLTKPDLADTKPPTGTNRDSSDDPPSTATTTNPTARQAAPPPETGHQHADASRQGERAQSSRRGRAGSWERRRDRDANRTPSGRRDRVPGEDAPGFWQGRQDQAWLWRQEQNFNPMSSSRHDRSSGDDAPGANFWNRALISHGPGGRNRMAIEHQAYVGTGASTLAAAPAIGGPR
jgi:hypothetical protein